LNKINAKQEKKTRGKLYFFGRFSSAQKKVNFPSRKDLLKQNDGRLSGLDLVRRENSEKITNVAINIQRDLP
jgi:hypothetical protein